MRCLLFGCRSHPRRVCWLSWLGPVCRVEEIWGADSNGEVYTSPSMYKTSRTIFVRFLIFLGLTHDRVNLFPLSSISRWYCPDILTLQFLCNMCPDETCPILSRSNYRMAAINIFVNVHLQNCTSFEKLHFRTCISFEQRKPTIALDWYSFVSFFFIIVFLSNNDIRVVVWFLTSNTSCYIQ